MAGLALPLLDGNAMPGGHRMRFTTRTFAAALAFVLAGTAIAHAQQKKTFSQPLTTSVTTTVSDQLVILSTTVNRTNQTLTVQGVAFGNEAPQVWLETQPMTVMSATSTQLVVFLPAAVPDGTYLLTVQRGTAEKDRDVFDTTIGTRRRCPSSSATGTPRQPISGESRTTPWPASTSPEIAIPIPAGGPATAGDDFSAPISAFTWVASWSMTAFGSVLSSSSCRTFRMPAVKSVVTPIRLVGVTLTPITETLLGTTVSGLTGRPIPS